MTEIALVRASLEAFQSYTQEGDGVRVSTHCMYPTNTMVEVVVRGIKEFSVYDDGGAVREAANVGLEIGPVKNAFAQVLRRQGLHVNNGTIYSPPVPEVGIAAAIVLVANASKEACEWCFDHFRYKRTRKFKDVLAQLIGDEFGDRALREISVLGSSHKQQKFEFGVPQGERLTLIDSVTPDAASVNSRIVSNLDVRNLKSAKYDQYIVFDDEEKWRSSDLTLLKMAADIVPFSTAPLMFRGIGSFVRG